MVGFNGVLRFLIEIDRVLFMILWGGLGIGKMMIVRCIVWWVGSRFIEFNVISIGVVEVKKFFVEVVNEFNLMGRKIIIFCDEIYRFSKF